MDSDRRILSQLQADAAAMALLFSNAGQSLQERTVVAGLLRALRVRFKNDEIVKRGPEPTDVWFRDARFQVTEILDRGRRRDSEVRQRALRIRNAQRLNQLIEPGTVTSNAMAPAEYIEMVSERAESKNKKYGKDSADIDLAVYVNLKRRHLYPTASFPEISKEQFSSWRSVSAVMEGFAMVLWASAEAPQFVKKRRGKPFVWTRLESVFPRLD